MSSRHGPPKVAIVLDTNCLFTEAAHKLVSQEISDFILKEAPSLGVPVDWHLPSVVKAERKYQMLERARKLLPNLQKLENLLGHALGITEEVLEVRVDEAIRQQAELHQLNDIDVDVSKVDWESLIAKAVRRLAPFDAGEKEKGFRDALILEAFLQLLETRPKTPSVARCVLLTGDKLLQAATKERTANRSNVIVLDDLDALRTMLNAIASHLTQQTIEAILPEALKLFFVPNEKETLFYKGEISAKIRSEFSDILEQVPDGFLRASTKKYVIGSPTFLGKERQRLQLATKVRAKVEATGYKTVASTASTPPVGLLSGLAGLGTGHFELSKPLNNPQTQWADLHALGEPRAVPAIPGLLTPPRLWRK